LKQAVSEALRCRIEVRPLADAAPLTLERQAETTNAIAETATHLQINLIGTLTLSL
jgi:hypothetical protein